MARRAKKTVSGCFKEVIPAVSKNVSGRLSNRNTGSDDYLQSNPGRLLAWWLLRCFTANAVGQKLQPEKLIHTHC